MSVDPRRKLVVTSSSGSTHSDGDTNPHRQAQTCAEAYAVAARTVKLTQEQNKAQRQGPSQAREEAKAKLLDFLRQHQSDVAQVTLPGSTKNGKPMYVRRTRCQRVSDLSLKSLQEAIDSIQWDHVRALSKQLADLRADATLSSPQQQEAQMVDAIHQFVADTLRRHHVSESQSFDVTTACPRGRKASDIPVLPSTHIGYAQQFIEAKAQLKTLRDEQKHDSYLQEAKQELQRQAALTAQALQQLPPAQQTVAVPLTENGVPVRVQVSAAATASPAGSPAPTAASASAVHPPDPLVPVRKIRWTGLQRALQQSVAAMVRPNATSAASASAPASAPAPASPPLFLVAASLVCKEPECKTDAQALDCLQQLKTLIWNVVAPVFQQCALDSSGVADTNAASHAPAAPRVVCRRLPSEQPRRTAAAHVTVPHQLDVDDTDRDLPEATPAPPALARQVQLPRPPTTKGAGSTASHRRPRQSALKELFQ